MTSKEIKIFVNCMPVQIGKFVQQLIKSVIEGIYYSLKGYGEARNIKLIIDNDMVEITAGNDDLQLNPFVSKFIKNTIIGMVSSLEGVNSIDKLEINIS